MTHLTLRLPIVLSIVIAGLFALAPGAHAAAAVPPVPAPPTRCDTPYDPEGTTLVGAGTMAASAPALRWLRAVYGAQAPDRLNVLREVAVRPCSIDGRGAITIWSTNPRAMIRRAWRQAWIHDVDIQWVRVRFGSRDAFRAVAGVDDVAIERLARELGGQVTTVGDDPARDCIRVGIHADFLIVPDPDAIVTRIIGRPACVVFEQPAMPA